MNKKVIAFIVVALSAVFLIVETAKPPSEQSVLLLIPCLIGLLFGMIIIMHEKKNNIEENEE